MRFWTRTIVVSVLLSLLWALPAGARCDGSFLNPITDISWNVIFPIRIGGITIIKGDIDDPGDSNKNAICVCKTNGIPNKIGLTVSFWEPSRMIETIKDPWCFPVIGSSLNENSSTLRGTKSGGESDAEQYTAVQSHYWILAVWHLLDLFWDIPCLDAEEFDVAYMTELDPTWNDDTLGFVLSPESLLFANPVANMSCTADGIVSNASTPVDELFWCMGSWGSSYPLTGHVKQDNYITGNAAGSSRMIYKMAREMMLWDPAVDFCGKTLTPIWVKSHYRLQVARPAKDKTAQPIGRSASIWGANKNPTGGTSKGSSDNFLWIMSRKVQCCINLLSLF